jgi:hypothetical protein
MAGLTSHEGRVLYLSHQDQYEYGDCGHSQRAGREVSPPAAIWPSRQRCDKQYDREDQYKHAKNSCRTLLSMGSATTAVTHPDSAVSYFFCDVANPAEANPVCPALSAQLNEQATACLYGVVPLVDMYGVASEQHTRAQLPRSGAGAYEPIIDWLLYGEP